MRSNETEPVPVVPADDDTTRAEIAYLKDAARRNRRRSWIAVALSTIGLLGGIAFGAAWLRDRSVVHRIDAQGDANGCARALAADSDNAETEFWNGAVSQPVDRERIFAAQDWRTRIAKARKAPDPCRALRKLGNVPLPEPPQIAPSPK